jgi:hypothetical protein
MLHPTPEELSHHVSGGHTVGALDGGAGLLGLGWSLHHGDLRIPHFFGLHAVQVIPFLVFFLRRMRRTRALAFVIAGSYLSFVAILTWQALRGESIVEPGTATLAALGVWLLATTAGAIATQIGVPAQHAVGANS